jgi:hypothetical protein
MGNSIKVGAKFFWNPSIFPYYIVEENKEYVSYKRDGYATKRVYRYVFEDAINSKAIEFVSA